MSRVESCGTLLETFLYLYINPITKALEVSYLLRYIFMQYYHPYCSFRLSTHTHKLSEFLLFSFTFYYFYFIFIFIYPFNWLVLGIVEYEGK